MKEKDLIYKMWWLNIVGVVVMLGSFAMLIITPIMSLNEGYEALWATTFTGATNSIRKEATILLDVFIAKFKKINNLKGKKGGK